MRNQDLKIFIVLLSLMLAGCGITSDVITGGGSSDVSMTESDGTADMAEPAGMTEEETAAAPPPGQSSGNVGTYSGRVQLIFVILGQSSTRTRGITIKISEDGSVLIIGDDRSVRGKLSGKMIVARIPVSVSQGGVSCSGNLSLTVNVGVNSISGRVSGTLPCNVGPAAVKGTFIATR